MSRETIGVVYLCRAGEREDLFVQFVDSYKSNCANCEHDLVIIFKGFEGLNSERKKVEEMFSGLDYKSCDLPDEGFDIGSYLAVARLFDYCNFLFFNTHTRIQSENWLKKIYQSIKDPSIGLVGTSASYESNYTNHVFIQRFMWLYQTGRIRKNDKSLDYYGSLIPEVTFLKDRTGIRYRIKDFFNKIFNRENISGDELTLKLKEIYPSFPNPHIRSNGFFISKKLLLDLCGDLKIQTKNDAYSFECGYSSLTRRVWKENLKTVIVGNNGIIYDVPDWPNSNTFGLGDQSNLLISDNQTDYFKKFSEKEGVLYSWMKWGDCRMTTKNFQTYGFQMKKFTSIGD